MAVKPSFADVVFYKASSGFHEGYGLPIALISKISIALLVLWLLSWPIGANDALSDLNWYLLKGFNTFCLITAGLIAAVCIVMTLPIIAAVSGVGRKVRYFSNLDLVLWPKARLSQPRSQPICLQHSRSLYRTVCSQALPSCARYCS